MAISTVIKSVLFRRIRPFSFSHDRENSSPKNIGNLLKRKDDEFPHML
jgi:hypothetical protein